MVAGDASARPTTSTGNIITTEHSHLMICVLVLTGGSLSARSKFAHECDVACGQYHIYVPVCICIGMNVCTYSKLSSNNSPNSPYQKFGYMIFNNRGHHMYIVNSDSVKLSSYEQTTLIVL